MSLTTQRGVKQQEQDRTAGKKNACLLHVSLCGLWLATKEAMVSEILNLH